MAAFDCEYCERDTCDGDCCFADQHGELDGRGNSTGRCPARLTAAEWRAEGVRLYAAGLAATTTDDPSEPSDPPYAMTADERAAIDDAWSRECAMKSLEVLSNASNTTAQECADWIRTYHRILTKILAAPPAPALVPIGETVRRLPGRFKDTDDNEVGVVVHHANNNCPIVVKWSTHGNIGGYKPGEIIPLWRVLGPTIDDYRRSAARVVEILAPGRYTDPQEIATVSSPAGLPAVALNARLSWEQSMRLKDPPTSEEVDATP